MSTQNISLSGEARRRLTSGFLAVTAAFVLLASALAAQAHAGSVIEQCRLDPGYACKASGRHTYNTNYVSTVYGADYYVCSWLNNPSTGTDINVKCGNGNAGSYYRNNTDVFLDGLYGNYDSRGRVLIEGRFYY